MILFVCYSFKSLPDPNPTIELSTLPPTSSQDVPQDISPHSFSHQHVKTLAPPVLPTEFEEGSDREAVTAPAVCSKCNKVTPSASYSSSSGGAENNENCSCPPSCSMAEKAEEEGETSSSSVTGGGGATAPTEEKEEQATDDANLSPQTPIEGQEGSTRSKALIEPKDVAITRDSDLYLGKDEILDHPMMAQGEGEGGEMKGLEAGEGEGAGGASSAPLSSELDLSKQSATEESRDDFTKFGKEQKGEGEGIWWPDWLQQG